MPPRTPPPPAPLPAHWFHILLALADGPRHGLGITQEVAERSGGQAQVWPGMLYLALRRMTAEGLVVEADVPAGFAAGGGRPRFYRLTPAGRRACAAEAERLARLVDTARAKRLIKRPRTT
jgi:DNA-binding PadR family transcriptional regulator